MSYRLGVDIGGTFADFCVLDEATGALSTLKVLSTPATPGAEVIAGLEGVEQRFGIGAEAIAWFTHGTTVGVNAVIQRKGIRLALFVTRHFRDVLELARLKSPDPYHLLSERPKPLVTRDRVFEIDGRLAADGSELEPLDEASVEAALRQAEATGAEGIVLALLHSYRNPAHEHAAKAVLARLRPDLPVYCSADVWPIIREYERTVTATVHGHAQPRVAEYLGSLQSALKRAGVAAEPMVTKSNGGVMRAELGKTRCVEMLLSGTAAGAIGARNPVAVLSPESLTKNLREHPDIGPAQYRLLPELGASPDLIVQDGDLSVVIVRRGQVILWAAVKATRTGKASFVTSFRRTHPADIRRLLSRGKVIFGKWEE